MPRRQLSAAQTVVTVSDLSPRFLLRPFAVLALATLALLAVAAPAHAQKQADCAKQVIADWFDNNRVDHQYDLHCYRDAIRSIPVDVLDYSSAKEDIERALSYRTRGQSDPGDPNSSGGGGSGTSGGGGAGGGSGSGGTGSGTTDTVAVGDVDTSGPSSVPIPLIVLGGLAVLLLVAGSAGYLTRRARGGEDGSPPTAA